MTLVFTRLTGYLKYRSGLDLLPERDEGDAVGGSEQPANAMHASYVFSSSSLSSSMKSTGATWHLM